MTEKAFMQQVIDLARLRGFLVYHPFDSRRSAPGFPDLVMVRGDQLLFVECKTDSGRLTGPQETWLEALGDVERVGARVWRPEDWPTIERVLAGR